MGRTSGGCDFNEEKSSIDVMSGYRSFIASILFDRNDITNSTWECLLSQSVPYSRVQFHDMNGTQKLEGELTTSNGKVVWDLNGITRSDWKTLGHYDAQGDPRWDGIVRLENRTRK